MPGSKSLTNRHLVLGLLAAEATVVHHPLVSRDTTLMLTAVQRLGAQVSEEGSSWRLVAPPRPRGDVAVECGLAGTVFRFLPPVAALAQGAVRFDGDEQARTRPVGPLLGAMRELGVRVDDGGRGTLPFTVHGAGPVTGGELTVDASGSSQFVSALLLAAPRFERGLRLRHVGPRLPSLPHVRMTLQVLQQAGVDAEETAPGTWRVAPGPVRGGQVVVEPDLSTAAPFLAAAVVTGGVVTVPGWPRRSTQPGAVLPELLTAMGARTELTDDGLTVHGPARGELRGLEADLGDVGELTPVLAAACALASTPSRLSGVAHLRGHETDRLHALEAELAGLGAGVRQTADGLELLPGELHGARFQTYADHRMVMAAAVLGLVVPGVVVADPGTVAKTYPAFVDAWSALVER